MFVVYGVELVELYKVKQVRKFEGCDSIWI